MKRTALILSVLLSMSVFCGCGKENDGADGEFYAVISSNPQNLDPQMATDKQSMFVIRNTYALLMDIDNEGMLVCGAAKNYTVSDDGLRYTFTIRDGLCWYGVTVKDPIKLTAYDYQYAFRRIFSSSTQSPHVNEFACIKNGYDVLNGIKNPSALGVKAIDDNTIEFELEYPNCDFLKLLTFTAASPCNEEIFLSTRGRYGLSAADTYSCGAFYLSDWNYDPYWTDNHITLERINTNSVDGYRTYPQLINIVITDDRKASEKQKNFKTDAYIIQHISEYDKDTAKYYSSNEYVSGTTCLFLSSDFLPFSDELARKALFSSIDPSSFTNELSEDSVHAYDIIPNAITVMSKSFRDFFASAEKNSSFSSYGWDNLVNEHSEKDFNSSIMLVSDKLKSQSMPYSIISEFENKLSFYCTPVFKNENEFRKSVSEGEYQLMIDTVYSDFNMSDSFLTNVYRLSGHNDDKLEELIRDVTHSADINQKKDNIKKAEEYIIDNCYALPLSYEKEYMLTLSEDSDIWYDPYSETMLFKYAKKK